MNRNIKHFRLQTATNFSVSAATALSFLFLPNQVIAAGPLKLTLQAINLVSLSLTGSLRSPGVSDAVHHTAILTAFVGNSDLKVYPNALLGTSVNDYTTSQLYDSQVCPSLISYSSSFVESDNEYPNDGTDFTVVKRMDRPLMIPLNRAIYLAYGFDSDVVGGNRYSYILNATLSGSYYYCEN